METNSASIAESPAAHDAVLVLLQNLDVRLARLEDPGKKSILKKITENTGAIALFLGLVLSFASLYDVIVTKPEAERISALSQFNRAVSSAAQIRQELVQMQAQVKDQSVQLAIMSAAQPRILNEVATARAILRDVKDADVGIPQLITLYAEAFSAGDPAAGEFVQRAVNKTDASPYMRSEAKRYQAKYLFATSHPDEGRKAMAEAIALLPQETNGNAGRAFDLSDWVTLEFTSGDCAVAERQLGELAKVLRRPGISTVQRAQMVAATTSYLKQYQGQRCPMPGNMAALLN